jgi:hypothetical protein
MLKIYYDSFFEAPPNVKLAYVQYSKLREKVCRFASSGRSFDDLAGRAAEAIKHSNIRYRY